ncbi:hypothetical protein [Kribbella deserti]|uniref:Uncharacterized protein n=1 Tax=Kribbella deserti TaxID=1926257 RepID=A0ABV6QR06_9ACTN
MSDARHMLGGNRDLGTYKPEQGLQPVHTAVPPTDCLNGCTRPTEHGREPIQVEPPALICPACRKRLNTWLQQIPDTYTLLPLVVEHGTVTSNPETAHTKRPDPPAPMRLEVIDMLERRPGRGVLGLIHGWAQLVRDERHLTVPCRCRHDPETHHDTTQPACTVAHCDCTEYRSVAATVTSECALLTQHAGWITTQPWVSDLYTELKPLVRHLQDAVGDYRPAPLGMCVRLVARPGVPVDVLCGGTLYRDQTGHGVHCTSCGDRQDVDMLRRLGLKVGIIHEEAS